MPASSISPTTSIPSPSARAVPDERTVEPSEVKVHIPSDGSEEGLSSQNSSSRSKSSAAFREFLKEDLRRSGEPIFPVIVTTENKMPGWLKVAAAIALPLIGVFGYQAYANVQKSIADNCSDLCKIEADFIDLSKVINGTDQKTLVDICAKTCAKTLYLEPWVMETALIGKGILTSACSLLLLKRLIGRCCLLQKHCSPGIRSGMHWTFAFLCDPALQVVGALALRALAKLYRDDKCVAFCYENFSAPISARNMTDTWVENCQSPEPFGSEWMIALEQGAITAALSAAYKRSMPPR